MSMPVYVQPCVSASTCPRSPRPQADLEDPPSSQIDPAPYGGRSAVRLFHERFADEPARPGYEGPISVFAIQG